MPPNSTLVNQMPALVPGLQMLGEYQGSGSTEAQFLLRRSDGKMLLVSRMLYTLLECMTRTRDRSLLVGEMSSRLDRQFTPEGITYLVENKLRPLGLIQGQLPGAPAVPMLSLAARRAILPSSVVAGIAGTLSVLFRPPLLALLAAGAAASTVWLVLAADLSLGVFELLEDPGVLIAVLGLTLLGTLFHELGHAAAGTYGGATPGTLGVGIYLVWPAFYTDLTDSYRLSRAGRIRTDLGGIYFNLIFVLLLAGLFALTNSGVFLAAIALQYLLIVQQFIPFLRLDGYYLLTDLSGVPDLFALKKSAHRLLGGQPAEYSSLRPGVQLFVTYWTLLSAAALSVFTLWLIWRVPSVVGRVGRAVQLHAGEVLIGFQGGSPVAGLASALALVLIVIQLAGLSLLLGRVPTRWLMRLLPRAG